MPQAGCGTYPRKVISHLFNPYNWGDAIDLARRPLILFLLFCLWSIGSARADGRFGTPDWVAPDSLHGNAFALDGPRVAPRDHERGWETALRAPFRVVTLPVRLLASGLEMGIGFLGPRYLDPKVKAPPRGGFKLTPNIAYGAPKDMGIGPALSWSGLPEVDAHFKLAGSWSASDRRRASLNAELGERRPLALQLRATYDYEPNRRYFGIGNDTQESQRSYFLLERVSADATVRLGASPLRQLRLGGGSSSMSPRRGTQDSPFLEDVFAPGITPFEREATGALWYGVSGDLAALDQGRDPSRGLHARVDLRRAMGMEGDDPDFDQWRLEGRAYLPVFAKRRVIALRAVYAGVEPKGDSPTLPFYRLAASEGGNRFAGFASERFRDRQLLLGRLEYRWAILYRLNAIALYELGEVAPHKRAFRLKSAHRSYGGGLRFGLNETRTLRCELARSDEGLHAVVALRGDF